MPASIILDDPFNDTGRHCALHVFSLWRGFFNIPVRRGHINKNLVLMGHLWIAHQSEKTRYTISKHTPTSSIV